jgi:hypothetical protein
MSQFKACVAAEQAQRAYRDYFRKPSANSDGAKARQCANVRAPVFGLLPLILLPLSSNQRRCWIFKIFAATTIVPQDFFRTSPLETR